MTEETFSELVGRLEVAARERPQSYRARVIALAALAYVYVLGVVALALGALGLLIGLLFWKHNYVMIKLGFKAIVPLLGLLAAIGRALWVRLEPPTGIALERARAPRLFEMIDATRKQLGAPRAHV